MTSATRVDFTILALSRAKSPAAQDTRTSALGLERKHMRTANFAIRDSVDLQFLKYGELEVEFRDGCMFQFQEHYGLAGDSNTWLQHIAVERPDTLPALIAITLLKFIQSKGF
ncbi:hypothetical protein N7495_009383 [Penicillium taxi]|uniref:uncharacterized protein n=1 Tax=Penicillium taxi TaxID=168475 RepID=UPI00254578DA|nr:uncharacterized protein N7495_009383 [Penicillium taxi]KAJ5884873.1 hypothetical protein N7495_009383 [Penicillium taxi]